MKNLTTEEGRNQYGKLFWNADDIVMLHACSLKDTRCDQGHYGPHFMTFHRAFLLRYENSMLAVDPSIGAMPYWDYSKDTQTGECFEEECYIFSDNYFGSLSGNAAKNHAVTDGLFAYWPVVEWTSERFGSESNLDVKCTNEDWFNGTTTENCTRCCGDDGCVCDQQNDDYPTYLRDHDEYVKVMLSA